MKIVLEELLNDKYEFSAITGNKERSEENWEIKKLIPKDKLTTLTIENYLEAINSVENEENFEGTIYYTGLESINLRFVGEHMMGVYIREKNSKFYPAYILNLEYTRINDGSDIAYEAKSKIGKSNIEKTFEAFIGPNIETKD